MAAFDWIINAARGQAVEEDVFDYEAFADYREISDADLPVDSFFVDEMQSVEKSHRTQYISIFIVFFFAIVFFVVALFSRGQMKSANEEMVIFLVPIGFFIVGVFLLVILLRTGKALDNTSQTIEGLQRGVVLNKMTVHRDAMATVTNNVLTNRVGGRRGGTNDQVASFTFFTVFFPDSKTYIKHVFDTKSLGQAKISFGAKVVVYKLSVDSEARIMPTIHLEVPEELIERAKTVREERGISDQGRGLRTLSRRTDGTYVSQPVTKEGMNNGVKIYLILALLMLLFAAAPIIIAFIFMIVMHFRIVN
ncbi:MAG: DUF948 domain-containing protein [Clostridiaceae bacterium]|nr:DUF948 domain-containing protein [Clostridiaceae bacterium]